MEGSQEVNLLHIVFVYGTLKQGFHNSHLLKTDGAQYLGRGSTREKFPLRTDQFYVPFLLKVPGKGERVEGEVYRVSDEVLANLDKLEGVPKFYIREQVEIEAIDSCSTEEKLGPLDHDPWVYMLPEERIGDHKLSEVERTPTPPPWANIPSNRVIAADFTLADCCCVFVNRSFTVAMSLRNIEKNIFPGLSAHQSIFPIMSEVPNKRYGPPFCNDYLFSVPSTSTEQNNGL